MAYSYNANDLDPNYCQTYAQMHSPAMQQAYRAPPMSHSNSTDSQRSCSTTWSRTSAYSPAYAPSPSPRPYDEEYGTPNMYSSSPSFQPRSPSYDSFPRQDYSPDYSYPQSTMSDASGERNGDRYVCVYPGCNSTFSRPADLNRHQVSVHFPCRISCPEEGCARKGPLGFTRRDHLNEHLRQFHKAEVEKRTSPKSHNKKVGY
ncbi:hypothetical protein FQN57_001507 [Myotisia sp. PD_48]|nr:hypothetical protein FQN57_001507 [Myotisia sp. PD_48]